MKDPNRAPLAAHAVELENLGIVAVIDNDQADDGRFGSLGLAS